MSNKQNFVDKLMNDWQKQMQDYLNDPKVAEVMVSYYDKFQNSIQEIAKEFTPKSKVDADDTDPVTNDLNSRIKALETRVELLEKFLAAAFNQPK